MFVPRTFNTMRIVALLAFTALITLVSGFDFDTAVSQAVAAVSPADDTATASEEAPLAGELLPEVAPRNLASSPLALTPIGQFEAPVEVTSRPGDPRTIVVEQGGRVLAVDPTAPTSNNAASDNSASNNAASNNAGPSVVLDISDLTEAAGERGLLGAAFAPNADLLYVHYSDAAGDTVVAEYAIDPASAIADPASARIVLTVPQPYENHNGGELTFGPDDMLYLGLGDGGLADDPVRSALDLSSPLGKILRLDPTPSATGSFTVPSDNPFVETPSADPTIWSYGVRNPWKFSFDPNNGDLWIADVGQNAWEEINFAAAADGTDAGRGLSFGWSAFEGTQRHNTDQDASGHVDPLVTYERADGKCSISGGAVYRGSAIPELDGWYVFGDYCTGVVSGFDTTLSNADRVITPLAQSEALVAIAAGADGELYVVSGTGSVSRLT